MMLPYPFVLALAIGIALALVLTILGGVLWQVTLWFESLTRRRR